jgi:hypothetical protein
VSQTPVAVAGDTYVVRLRLHRSESSVMEPYAIDLIQQGIATFSRRYNFKLQEPVTVEMYPITTTSPCASRRCPASVCSA